MEYRVHICSYKLYSGIFYLFDSFVAPAQCSVVHTYIHIVQ